MVPQLSFKPGGCRVLERPLALRCVVTGAKTVPGLRISIYNRIDDLLQFLMDIPGLTGRVSFGISESSLVFPACCDVLHPSLWSFWNLYLFFVFFFFFASICTQNLEGKTNPLCSLRSTFHGRGKRKEGEQKRRNRTGGGETGGGLYHIPSLQTKHTAAKQGRHCSTAAGGPAPRTLTAVLSALCYIREKTKKSCRTFSPST